MLRSFRGICTLLRCAAHHWTADNASTTGAALAFYCAFAIAPLLVILLTLAGLVVDETAVYTQVGGQLVALFGPSTAKVLLGAVRSAQHTQGLVATAVSVVTLLLGATTVLAALRSALEVMWENGELVVTGVWGWVRTRLLSLGFILTLGFLLLVSLTVSTVLSNLRARVVHIYPGLVALIIALDILLSLLLVATLFALIYRYLPARRLPWRDVMVGGLLTAALFDLGRWGIGLYLAHSTEPSAFGAASSFAALLLWLYYTAQIFLFGAEFTSCLGGLREENQEEKISSQSAKNGQTIVRTDSRRARLEVREAAKSGIP